MRQSLLISIIIVVVCIVLFVGYQYMSQKYINLRTTAQNLLNEKDSLHRVYISDVKFLNERYVSMTDDLSSKIENKDKELKAHIKKSNITIKNLSHIIQDVSLENIQLKTSKVYEDSFKYTANFDTVNRFFEISQSFTLEKNPLIATLSLNRISFLDSMYIGNYETKEGFIKGFIYHSNPYIKDKDANFYIEIPKNNNLFNFSTNGWVSTALIIGFLIGFNL